jgi:Leucine-rich repeat (LRR) protein
MNQTINIRLVLLKDNGEEHKDKIKVTSQTLQYYMEHGMNEVTFNKEKLIEMDFSSNSIEILGKNLFDSCPNLQKIDFFGNKLKELDKDLFSGCKETLTEINFGNNEIGYLHPDLFSGCQKLTTINFEENKLEELYKGLFSGCRDSLKKVYFYDNSFERLDKDLFDSCSNLQIIDFTKNKIKELDKNLFSGCKKSLSEIYFGNNAIGELHPDLFSGYLKLEKIDFEENKLKELNKGLFIVCKNSLKKIDFSSNSFEKLDKDLFVLCSNLEIIIFNKNKIKELDVKLFSGCEKTLTKIDFGNNAIGELHPDLFSGCQKLEYISFINNKLKELKQELFSGCWDSLKSINFSSNEIENLHMEIFKNCYQLTNVFFNMNKLKKLDGNLFIHCRVYLEEVSFENNQIDLLYPGLFSYCGSLRRISFKNNKLKELNKDTFQGCFDLHEINFSFNRLKDVGNINLEEIIFNELNRKTWDIIDINFSNNCLTSFPYFSTKSEQKYKIDFRNNLHLLDSFQLLFRKLDKNNREQEHLLFDNVKDKDIVLYRQNNIESLLFLIILNSKIYNNEDDNVFKEKYAYFNDVKQKKISILDFLILIGNDCFSNEYLIHLNEEFEIESKTPNLVNLEFRIKNPDSIEALCQRNDYSTFKKMFDLDRLELKVDNPKEFIESINFLKCFDIALNNNNEKIGKYLLEILSFYTFNSKMQVRGSISYSHINKIDDKFNEKFLDSDSLNELNFIKIIKTLSNKYYKKPKREKDGGEVEEDRDGGKVEEEFKGDLELFLDMKISDLYRIFRSLDELKIENNLNIFNQIFLRIYFEAFFHFEWFEAIEFFFDQCKRYTEVELDDKIYPKIVIKEKEKEKEFLPFFCFNKIGYIQRQQQINSNNKVNTDPQSDEKIEHTKSTNQVFPEPPSVENIQQNKSESQSNQIKTITVPFSNFSTLSLVRKIQNKSIRKKFLNHPTFLNLIKMEWVSIFGLIYYLRLFMYLIFLVFYSINIEIYSKSNTSSSKLNMACKLVCFIFLFIFWFIEIFQLIFYAIQRNVFGYILDFKNSAEFINFPLCIFSLFYDIYGSEIEVKSSFYTITILISYYIFIKRLDKISFLNIGAKINVIGKIIKKSFSITLLLLVVAIGFILSFRNRSTYYEMSGLGGDDLTQMSTFNTTFEFNLFQILQFGLGGIATSEMGIDMIQGSNFVNYIIYGCFIFIMPIMFFNILTAISLDAIGDMMINASDDIILNKIDYFELKEFYNNHIMENKEDKKFRNWIGRKMIEINEKIFDVQKYIYEEVYLYVRGNFWYYFRIEKLFKTNEEKGSTEENLNLAKTIEKSEENLISMIKSLSKKVEINDREVKQEIIETESNTNELLKIKFNEIDVKLNKMDEKFEKILMTLNLE